ncbi:DUF1672 family protein, partial [Staphylococcus argensis]
YTKEALINTQADGYANEYFYISYTPEQLSTYKKYYEPLIKKNQKDFEEGMKYAREATHYTAKPDVVTTLFSTKKKVSKKYNFEMATRIAKSIEKNNTNMPTTSSIDVMYTGNEIRTQKPYWGGQNGSSYQIF